MFRTLAMFPTTAHSHFDMDYFVNRHVPMVEEVLSGKGLVHISVEEGVALAPPGPALAYAALASLTFSTLEALEEAMVTCGAKLSADFPTFTDVRPQVQVNRVMGLASQNTSRKPGTGALMATVKAVQISRPGGDFRFVERAILEGAQA